MLSQMRQGYLNQAREDFAGAWAGVCSPHTPQHGLRPWPWSPSPPLATASPMMAY